MKSEMLRMHFLGTSLSFSKSTFYFDEYEGQAQPELALSVPAPFDFVVFVESSNVDLSSELFIIV